MTITAEDSNLVHHARAELEAIGQFAEDPEFAESIVQAVAAFAGYGHSGGSAGAGIAMLHQLLQFQPLGPLTGADEEWVHVADEDGQPLYQNKRCGGVFKKGDRTYYIDAVVFRDPDGSTWTNGDSVRDITFPYTPTTEIVDRPAED